MYIDIILSYKPLYLLVMITCGIFGAMVGSFLNVCIYRLPKEHISIVTPRSRCPHCGKGISWYSNIPIVSWLCLGGACEYCRYPISFRYTFVEMLCSVLFLFFMQYLFLTPLGNSPFYDLSFYQRIVALVIAYYFIGTMIAVTFIDIDYRIIPQVLTHPGIVLAPIVSFFFPYLHPEIVVVDDIHMAGLLSSVLGIFVGGGSLYITGVFGKIVFGKEAMGFGDVMLMAFVGGFLGWDSALLIFFSACFIGTFFGIINIMVTKDHYLPFGPYLASATLIVFLFKNNLIDFVLYEWPQLLRSWLI